jgi:hypothetical protein
MWSIANADFFTGIRVAAQDSPANVHAVFARAVVTSFGVFFINGNANSLLLLVLNRLTRGVLCENPTRHQGECDQE